MLKKIFIYICAIFGIVFFSFVFGAVLFQVYSHDSSFSNEEVEFEETADGDEAQEDTESNFPNARNWIRPQGQARVGLQAGHWKVEEVPEELSGLKRNGSGAVGGGKLERDINLSIVKLVVPLLEEKGIVVDILPVTIPQDYVADAFIAIHADGNTDTNVSGFKIAAPRRDYSGKSSSLAEFLEGEYQGATSMAIDPNITRRMRGYYAFNWRRYEHAIHFMTPAVIVETGFLTSPKDRNILVSRQDKAADGIAKGIIRFLESQGLLH